MANFRIWNLSEIIYSSDRVGKFENFWNKIVNATLLPPGPSAGRSSYNPTHFKDWEEEQKLLRQPTIVLENMNANYSPIKQQMMESAGIKGLKIEAIKGFDPEPEVTITNVQVR